MLVWEQDTKILTDHMKHNSHLYSSVVSRGVQIARILALVAEIGTTDNPSWNNHPISEPGG